MEDKRKRRRVLLYAIEGDEKIRRIQTATDDWIVLTGDKEFIEWLDPHKPWAIKYSGLANGKGVYITRNEKEFVDAFHDLYDTHLN